MGLNSDYSRAVFGRETRYNPRPLANTVAITATELWMSNADRLALVLQNLGAFPIYVGSSPTVTATTGLLLAAGGGVLSLNVADDGETPALGWWAIAVGGASAIFAAEVVGV
jgi:hypothetical protein